MFLGEPAYAWAVVVVAPALLLQLRDRVELGTSTDTTGPGDRHGDGRVQRSRGRMVVVSVAGWGTDALPIALVATSAVSLLTAAADAHRSVAQRSPQGERGPGERSGPLARRIRWDIHAEPVVGTGAQLLIPVIILSLLGQDAVGYVRAASAVAIGYLSILMSAMARDYFPRAAAAEAGESALRRLVADQGRLVLALSAPLILATSALAPDDRRDPVFRRVFPGDAVLEWMLVGDVLKLLSWTGSFVILARGGPGRYFAIELIGGACLLSRLRRGQRSRRCRRGHWDTRRLCGLPGCGVGRRPSDRPHARHL